MKNAFGFNLNYASVTVLKCSPPVSRKTPEGIQRLSCYYQMVPSDYKLVVHDVKNMDAVSYEYSRLGIKFGLENIIEDLHEKASQMSSLIYFKDNKEIFQSVFENMVKYFEEVKSKLKNKISKKYIKDQIDFATMFSEGVWLLGNCAKFDITLTPLIQKYKEYENHIFETLQTNQQALHLINNTYKIIEEDVIRDKAYYRMKESFKFDYSALYEDNLTRLSLDAGSRNDYWVAIQNEKTWKEYYEKGILTVLSERDLEVFRTKLPVVFSQYENIEYNSFTNFMKVIALTTKFRGEVLSSRNETRPKDDKEYNEKLLAYNLELADYEKYGLGLRPRKPQKPDITHENLEFSSRILTSGLNLTILLDSVSGRHQDENCLLLKKSKSNHVVVTKQNSNVAVIFYEDPSMCFGCLIDVNDLDNGKILSFKDACKKSKGSSFHSLSHFLRELQYDWVQEYYFGKNNIVMSILDKRS